VRIVKQMGQADVYRSHPKRRAFLAPRDFESCGAHSAPRQHNSKPSRHDLNTTCQPVLCRRFHLLRMRRSLSERACAASSRGGVRALS
jgi:hypothetical protein